MRNTMSVDELYDERYLDELAGTTAARREDEAVRAEFSWLDELDADKADAELNQMLEPYKDSRGRPLPGFEPVGSTPLTASGRTAWKPGTKVTDAEIHRIMAERRRIELEADPEQTRRALGGTWR